MLKLLNRIIVSENVGQGSGLIYCIQFAPLLSILRKVVLVTQLILIKIMRSHNYLALILLASDISKIC